LIHALPSGPQSSTALSAGAIVLDHVVLRLRPPEAAVYQEDRAEK
jgi:hypothetical protein